MDSNPVTVKLQDLKPGMKILGITRLSSEYSYLDSKRVKFLKQYFPGATAIAVRIKGEESIPTESITAGDHIKKIEAFPDSMKYSSANSKMAILFQDSGFLEFLVEEVEDTTAPEKAPAKPARATPPKFKSAGSAEHARKVDDTKQLLEKMDTAAEERGKAALSVEEMLKQAQAGRHSMLPATEAIDGIVRAEVSGAMAAISGLKASDQTYAHCVDMSVLFNEAAIAILKSSGHEPNYKIISSTLAAGFMHDIGKSMVPKDILESTERFAVDSREMQIMRSHVTYSAKILTDADADNTMINVAHYHHVKRDTSLPSSYPRVEFSKLLPMTRLASVADVYQALIGKRNYKKNWVPAKAIALLKKLRGSEFDNKMVDNFVKVFGTYPVGSLVRISTGDLAFVTKVEDQEAERPVIAVVENASGELLSANPLVDLMVEPDISIVEAVDHYEHYDEFIDQSFEIFKALTII